MSPSALKEIKIVTHSGGFHPDDVFAAVVLVILFENKFISLIIKRSRDREVWKNADFLIDVGGEYDPAHNRFDHHQIGGAGERGNGVPYASFGLVWKKFGREVAGSSEVADSVDGDLVQFIDAADNGVGELRPVTGSVYPYSISRAIFSLNPSWREGRPDFDSAFGQAVNFAVPVLRRAIAETRDKIDGERVARVAYDEASDKRLIILNHSYSWDDLYRMFSEPLFVVEPVFETADEVMWRLKTVRQNPRSFENRKDLPAEWAGKRDAELAAVTGVPDAIFCHNRRFVAYAKTKEGAIALAQKALLS